MIDRDSIRRIKENEMDNGLVIWLTGLAGSGKSTVSRALYNTIRSQYCQVIYLDGDELRDILGHYGYDKQGRIEVSLKRSKFANFLSKQGMIVIVSAISMFKEVYTYNRATLPNYFEVYIQCDMQELIKRDQKGLYSKALRGLEKNVVGIDIAFDEPNPHLVIHNTIPNCLDEKAHCIVDNVRHLLPKIS